MVQTPIIELMPWALFGHAAYGGGTPEPVRLHCSSPQVHGIPSQGIFAGNPICISSSLSLKVKTC
jgi:hypothetical protein